MGSVLLVLSHGRLPLDHLHFHSARHEQLPTILPILGSLAVHLLCKDRVVLALGILVVVVYLMIANALGW